MNQFLKRLRRPLTAAVLGLGLTLTGALDQSVRAQPGNPNDPNAAAEEPRGGSGRVFDGYAGTFILAFLVLFLVGKSARR
jgi:hypothetical protein